MFTLGEYAESYSNKHENVTIVAEDSKREFTVRVGFLTRILYMVVSLSTEKGARITVGEEDFADIASYLHLSC